MTLVAHPRYAEACSLTILGGVLLLLLAADMQFTVDVVPSGGAPLSTSLSVSGSIDSPLFPGAMAPVDVSFTNPYLWPISITELRVSVQKVMIANPDVAGDCTTDDFTITQLATDHAIIVPARSTVMLSDLGIARQQWPAVGMLDRAVNQDGCRAANVMLGFVASGNPKW